MNSISNILIDMRTTARKISPFRPSRLLFTAVACLCVFGLSCAKTSFAATGNPPKIVGVRVGFADRYKVGLWTPVEVTLAAEGETAEGEVAVIVPDSDGVPTRVATPSDKPCRVGSDNTPTTVTLIVRFGRVKSDLKVEFCGKDGSYAHRVFHTANYADQEHFLPAIDSKKLVLAIGSTSLSDADFEKIQGIEASQRPVIAQLDDLDNLPVQWNAYEGVDAILFQTNRLEFYQKITENDPRMDAVEQWISLGGRAVLSVGPNGKELLGDAGPLRRFVPGKFDRVRPLPQTGALENFCGGASTIPSSDDKQSGILSTKLSAPEGVIEANLADLPLVIRSAHGFGQILFVAVDLEQHPLADWSSRPQFVAKLLDIPIGRLEESNRNTVIMHHGYNDLSGQLRSALDQFDGIGIASFSLVAGLIVLYILLIGPGDYFLLQKVVKKMTWTWFTFPLVAILATAGAYFMAQSYRGHQPRLNQIDLVDIDAVSGLVRGSTWSNLFSPKFDTFKVSLKPNSLSVDSLPANTQAMTTWFGLPGNALGGMNPQMGDVSIWNRPYLIASDLEFLSEMPLQVGATKSLTGRWKTSTSAFPKTSLVDDNGLLIGNIVNTYPFPLEQCILVYGLSVYDLGAIAPNGSFRVDSMTRRSELKTMLTGRKVVAISSSEKYRPESTPYDQSNTDLSYVVRMMMFHQAAGGTHYTGLTNSYQEFVDLSVLLKTNRAILVAQSSAEAKKSYHGAELSCNDHILDNAENKHVTMLRFVLPVKPSGEKQAEISAENAEQLAALPKNQSSVPQP